MRSLLIWFLCALPALADGERAGDFDYYVLSLSWSPNWCALEGDARGSPQCTAQADFGWVLHGLWPQYDAGYPSWCPVTEKAPSRAMTAAMADVMGTSGLAWYQWKKHGVCSGLGAGDYYALAREAYDRITRPELFRRLDKAVRLPAEVVEQAFLRDNPDMVADGITVTCRSGRIQEVRICLTRDLAPMRCGRDVRSDCRLEDALLDPIP